MVKITRIFKGIKLLSKSEKIQAKLMQLPCVLISSCGHETPPEPPASPNLLTFSVKIAATG